MSTETAIEPEMSDAISVPEGYRLGKNGGLLRTGNLGGKGGSGRPNKDLRKVSQYIFEKANDKLLAILDKDLTPMEITSIMDKAGKYGIGEVRLGSDEFAILAGECFAELVPDSDLVKQFASNLAERLKLGG